ncbi:hypothetical protein PTTG_26178 [Puccinia triticina 1-1 BBBD Race 1]|uniref:Hydrophobin n=1 Tax=Puccinia triticina (isolate 1-1 / race 1 (BBBD)) TaxID=630390 RepID=A0A180GWI8_PUCT1|nr:hypothetical protein PTTG_26178 [Puccinia triticina 1-1 BBBD Race 1]
MHSSLPFLIVLLNATIHLYAAPPILRGLVAQKSTISVPDLGRNPLIGGTCGKEVNCCNRMPCL